MLRKEIYRAQENIKKDVSKLFLEAFPEEERPPLPVFLKSLQNKNISLLAFYQDQEFIGFAYLAFYQDICCLFFLAVSSTYRHKGFGGQILEIIKDEYRDYVIMLCYEEVGSQYQNYEERVLRKAFYLSHGFINNKIKTNEYGVIYETAYIGSHQVSFSQYLEIFKMVFGDGHEKYVTDATNY